MIIDCHGHYTTTPPGVGAWREAQVSAVDRDPSYVGEKGTVDVSDDEIRASLETAQLQFQRDRGADLTLFSPRASWMAHHVGNEHTSTFWSQHQNELIRRVCDLYPSNFAPVCQLPQSPGAAIDGSVAELRRCVGEMGFVGCNVNPDPSGGFWTGPPLWDRSWWPLWEAMCELDVPAMIHVSASCNENLFTTGSHYLGRRHHRIHAGAQLGVHCATPGACGGSSPTEAAPSRTTGDGSRAWPHRDPAGW